MGRNFSFVKNMKTLAILLFGILYIQNGILSVTVKAHFKRSNNFAAIDFDFVGWVSSRLECQMLCMFRRKSDNSDFCQFYGFKPTTNMCRLSYTPPQCSPDPRDKKGTWETWVLADTDWTKQCIDSWENP